MTEEYAYVAEFKWVEGQKVGSPETVKKIVMLAILVSLTAGCAPLHPSSCHKTTATGSCSSGHWDDQDEWGVQARAIRAAINAELDEPQNWKGKKCRLHIEFAQDGTALNVSTSNGNEAYCEAIKSAAHQAKFPTFNNPEVYRDFQKSGFDMRG
ncbi:cell envelope integrity TolA C-terminal domain-containing protein [Serratia sp. IR-2025]